MLTGAAHRSTAELRSGQCRDIRAWGTEMWHPLRAGMVARRCGKLRRRKGAA